MADSFQRFLALLDETTRTTTSEAELRALYEQHCERLRAKRRARRRLMAPPDPDVEDFGDELGKYMRRQFEIAAKARAEKAAVEDYRTLGHTEAGARWHVEHDAAARAPPSQDLAASPANEAYFPPFPPFSIGDRHIAYEWMMLWADREPYASGGRGGASTVKTPITAIRHTPDGI